MTTDGGAQAKRDEIERRWLGVHMVEETRTGQIFYGAAHRHAGADIGWLLQQYDALAAQLADTTRARDLLAGSLAREQVTNGRLRAALQRTAIQPAAYHAGTVCDLCHAFNREQGKPIRHADGCLLANAGDLPHRD